MRVTAVMAEASALFPGDLVAVARVRTACQDSPLDWFQTVLIARADPQEYRSAALLRRQP